METISEELSTAWAIDERPGSAENLTLWSNPRMVGVVIGVLVWLSMPSSSPAQRFAAVQTPDSVLPPRQLNDDKSNRQAMHPGLDLILNKSFLPRDFDQETFDKIWMVWPEPLKKQAETADAETRRRMAFERYGLTPRPNDARKPMQFVVDNKTGHWSLNCFACHAGSLYDFQDSLPGLPNNRIALSTLYDDMLRIKKKLGKPNSYMDICNSIMPMGKTVGTSNAVIFGVSLMSFRNRKLDIRTLPVVPKVIHHDMDAPPWWNYGSKKMIYIDGFTQKHHRGLMPFIMVRENHGARFRGFEKDFQIIQKYIQSTKPPQYPREIDRKKAAFGETIFTENCAHCHGNYQEPLDYPEVTIDVEEIGTDPTRLHGLSEDYRRRYGESWLAEYGKAKTIKRPKGYVAPPLKGIWASAPYFHNGSVPTIRAVLSPETRPRLWKTRNRKLNQTDLGLEYQEFETLPDRLSDAERRLYFDTRLPGKRNTGHDYGQHLDKDEQDQLLEYLKTL